MNLKNLKIQCPCLSFQSLELDQTVTSIYESPEMSCHLETDLTLKSDDKQFEDNPPRLTLINHLNNNHINTKHQQPDDIETKQQLTLLAMTQSVDTPCIDGEVVDHENPEEYEEEEEDNKEDVDSVDEEEDFTVLSLFEMLTDTNEDVLFCEHGYRKEEKLCDTLQGELFKAEVMKKPGQYVAIKKVLKNLVHSNTAEQDGMTFVTQENIIKEAVIMKYLTVDNTALGNYICRFIDFFEGEDHYYLVTEYVEGMHLKDFIKVSRKYLKCGKLSNKDYQKVVKFITWQLITSLRFLHDVHHCCHLDLCLENVMLQNVTFKANADGSISIPPSMGIKICDFGVAEIFDTSNVGDFKCYKQGLNIDNEAYIAPKAFNGDDYDARAADMWSVGMIFFQLTTGKSLYQPQDMWSPQAPNGYNALINDKLKYFLKKANLTQFFNKHSFKLLLSLLSIDQQSRITAFGAIHHEFFKTYFKQYESRLTKKYHKDTEKLKILKPKMAQFPYYKPVKTH